MRYMDHCFYLAGISLLLMCICAFSIRLQLAGVFFVAICLLGLFGFGFLRHMFSCHLCEPCRNALK